MSVALDDLSVAISAVGQARIDLVDRNLIQSRLADHRGNDKVREKTLLRLFADAGCSGSQLSEQSVPRRNEPNVICVLRGETDRQIVVEAHFDYGSEADGSSISEWCLASAQSLQGLRQRKHRHTYVFVGFTGEEAEQVGSRFFFSKLSDEQVTNVDLMLAIDSIGLGPCKVWVSRSDKGAVDLLAATARALALPLAFMNIDGFGTSDEKPFLRRKVRTVTVHSITPENSKVLHSRFDNASAIRPGDYYDTHHLLAGYLVFLDEHIRGQQREAGLSWPG